MAFGSLITNLMVKSKPKLGKIPKLNNTLKFKPPVSPIKGSPREIAPKATRGYTSGVSIQGYSSTPQNSNIIRGNNKRACREALKVFEKIAKELTPEELESIAKEVVYEVIEKM